MKQFNLSRKFKELIHSFLPWDYEMKPDRRRSTIKNKLWFALKL